MSANSTAADSLNDLDFIVRPQCMRAMLTARYQGLVDLDREASIADIERRDQVGQPAVVGYFARVAIERNLHDRWAPNLCKPV